MNETQISHFWSIGNLRLSSIENDYNKKEYLFIFHLEHLVAAWDDILIPATSVEKLSSGKLFLEIRLVDFVYMGNICKIWKPDCLQLIFSLNLATPCLSTQQTLLILQCTNSPIMSLYFVTLVNLWFVLRPILLIQLEFTDNKITSLKYPQKMKSQ